MKFTEHLQAHLTPEWRKQYIKYEEMKRMLYGKERDYVNGGLSPAEKERYLINFDEEFFQFCDTELTKIDTFFAEKLAEAIRKFTSLKFELSVLLDASTALAAASADGGKKLGKKNGTGKGFWKKASSSVQLTPSRAKLESTPSKSLLNGGPPRVKSSTQLNDASASWVRWVIPQTFFWVKKSTQKKAEDLKLAFSEYYLSLVLLQNYQQLNYTGFRKILKKHDKLFSTDTGSTWRIKNVDCAPFYVNKDINRFILEVESLYTNSLVAGDRTKAMKRLRVPPLSEQKSLWTSFRLGLFLGFFTVLVTVILLAAIFTNHRDDWRPAVRIFRGAFLVVLFTYLLGINTYGWQSAGVNHVLIFEIDPRNHLTDQQILEIASILGVLWALAVIVYLFSEALHVPALLSPLVLVAIYILFLLNPTPTLYSRSRFWLLRILWRICNAPFYHVGFADFWLADQLNSLVTVFLDFEYFICYYAAEVEWLPDRKSGVCYTNSYGVRPVIAMLPAWFRFFQCLRRYRDSKQAIPHLLNAGKYSTTFFVVLFSTLNTFQSKQSTGGNITLYMWISAAVFSSLYAYAWDIKRDWGLLDPSAPPDAPLLREQMVYSKKYYYYFAMIEDFILRFAWTLTVSVGKEELLETDILISILAPLEVFRRFFWNFFRLENEHLNNCGQFRAVRDISIAPIDINDLAFLERHMDDDPDDDEAGKRSKAAAAAAKVANGHGLTNYLKHLKSSNALAAMGKLVQREGSLTPSSYLTVPLLTTATTTTPTATTIVSVAPVANVSLPAYREEDRATRDANTHSANDIPQKISSLSFAPYHHYLLSLNKLSSKITSGFTTANQNFLAPSANPAKSSSTASKRQRESVALERTRQLELQRRNQTADYTINPDYVPYVGQVAGVSELGTTPSLRAVVEGHYANAQYLLPSSCPGYSPETDLSQSPDPTINQNNYGPGASDNLTNVNEAIPAYERPEYTDTVISDIFKQICPEEHNSSKRHSFFGTSSTKNADSVYQDAFKYGSFKSKSHSKTKTIMGINFAKLFQPLNFKSANRASSIKNDGVGGGLGLSSMPLSDSNDLNAGNLSCEITGLGDTPPITEAQAEVEESLNVGDVGDMVYQNNDAAVTPEVTPQDGDLSTVYTANINDNSNYLQSYYNPVPCNDSSVDEISNLQNSNPHDSTNPSLNITIHQI